MYILDTDHMTHLELTGNVEGDRLDSRLQAVRAEDKATTIVAFEEQSRGWLARLKRARNTNQQVDLYRKLRRHLEIYGRIRVLDFDDRAAIEFDRLERLRLKKIGAMDLKIAAIALVHQAILLSRNLKDFRQIPHLLVEDWTIP